MALECFFYMGRDVLIRVFYALGDGQTPFKISIINIFINAILDYFLVEAYGAPGLVMATVGVNISSMIIFYLDFKPPSKWLAFIEVESRYCRFDWGYYSPRVLLAMVLVKFGKVRLVTAIFYYCYLSLSVF